VAGLPTSPPEGGLSSDARRGLTIRTIVMCVKIGGLLFTGDTLIKRTKEVVKLPGGDKAKLARSLDFILPSFPPNTVIQPGHGDAFLLRTTSKLSHQCPSSLA
jgi:hypothetical protein